MSDLVKLLGDYPWMLQVFVVLLTTLIFYYLAKIICKRIETKLTVTRNLWDDSLLHALRKPLSLFILLIGSTEIIGLLKHEKVIKNIISVDAARYIGITVLSVWFVLRYVNALEVRMTSSHYLKKPVDKDSATAIGKLLRGSVVALAVLMMMQSYGYSISGLLAFGGIGSIIIGFAAKDLLANFLGGLMLYLDRPFKVGDWVRSNDKQLEGIVEEIGWRVTCIRTFDKTPLYVPNSTFASISIENPSRMTHRRFNEVVHVRHEDASKVTYIIADIQEFLLSHPDIDLTQKIMVHLVSFSQSTLAIAVIACTKINDVERFALFKQSVLLKIIEIVSRHEAALTHPAK
jgi:MscS family membrane protein